MTDDTVRLDRWLWFARMARTRSLAARLCAAGLVTLGGTAQKPHHPVRVGDRIAVAQGRARRELVVLALGERRGSAPEARRLYDEPMPPVPLAAPEEAWTTLFAEMAEEEG
jgi:ribosome-associated heat shock protein Hsp15